MSAEVIAHMRDRIVRMRRIISLAHNQEMIRLVEGMIAEAEADIAKLEAETPTIEIKQPPSQI